MIPLPAEAQVSAINGMLADDFDGDGNMDVIMNGNDFGTDAAVGRYDALNGLFLKGDGKGNFKPLSILQSGIYIPGDGKALVQLRGDKGKTLVAASQHNDNLKIFQLKRDVKTIGLLPDDISAVTRYKNGKITRQEFYYGSSFLSQSGRFMNVGADVVDITILNSKEESRKVRSYN